MTITILPVRGTDPVGPPAAARPTAKVLRTDIQAVRAIAVTLVLIYHLWPAALTGGFVGVDVFFVVSGFLITAHLLARPPRTATDFAGFWARRIRRLLPAGLLVLAATVIASRLLAPDTQWANTAEQAAAATLYVQNWLLAGNSVDYLAATDAATPVQHFWSLSVEEQFYLVWPLLIALLVVNAVRRHRPRAIMLGLLVLVVTSLGASIVLTLQSPASAYFVTPTRAWEFGLGGLLAALLAYRSTLPPGPGRVRLTNLGRSVLAGLGLLGIGYAASSFDQTTLFPGWWALIPTLGTVAVLAARPTAEIGTLGRGLALRPVQWLGDVSYSVYLWHWPLIVLVPYVVGGRLSPVDQVAIIVLTLLLAGLTKRHVEDRYREPGAGRGLVRVFLAAVAGMALVLALAVVQLAEVGQRGAADEIRVDAALAADDPCFGAGSLLRPEQCRDASFDGVLPTPAHAARDRSDLHLAVTDRPACWADGPRFPVRTCHFGNPTAKRQLALVGNSHAAHWLPALQEFAVREGWGITTYVAARCALAPVDQRLLNATWTKSCREWGKKVSAKIEEGDFDLVVLGNRMARSVVGTATPAESVAAYQQAYEKLLTRWAEAGVPVLALRDTPAPEDAGIMSVPNCVAEHPADLDRCSGARRDWVPEEPLMAAVENVDAKRIRAADLTEAICGPDVCRPVVGGVLVYTDGQHLSATYARTLADPLIEQIERVTEKA